MMPIKTVLEDETVIAYLGKRDLLKQYMKAKRYILAGLSGQTKLKERRPVGSGVWSFRINKQFRAFGYFENKETFIVSKIDNHQ